MLSDKKLGAMLDSHKAPAPSDLLKARILKKAGVTKTPHRSFTKRYMGMAASLAAVCAVGFATLQATNPAPSDAEIWQEAAVDLGFSEIYEWVETEETTAQDQS